MTELFADKMAELKLDLRRLEIILFKLKEYGYIDNYIQMANAEGRLFIAQDISFSKIDSMVYFVSFKKFSRDQINFKFGAYNDENPVALFSCEFRDPEFTRFYGYVLNEFFNKARDLNVKH